MAIKSFNDYYQRLVGMKSNIYIGADKVGRTDSRLAGGIQIIKETFDRAQDPKYADLCTAKSHLTGEPVNRFCHIHQDLNDLLNKQQMTRSLCHRVGGCVQRCMGIDALNALSVVTYEMDQALGTDYDRNFREYLKYFQANDLVASCAQTDTKGHRLKRPHEQEDPDQYLRVVENKSDGIVVRGAKINITNAPYADELIVVPTRMMTEKDGPYAVAFAIPADAKGVHLLTRPAYHHRRTRLDAPLARIGDGEAMVVFDDVFVPKDRVFLNGGQDPRQTPYAGFCALLFAHYHRHSYTGCKPAVSEILGSAAALVAEYNGVEKESHVKEKISHLIGTAELVFAAGFTAAHRAEKSDSGTMIPDEILTNVGRRLAGESIYDEYGIVADLAGGLVATLPLEDTFYREDVGELAQKYLVRNPVIAAEDMHRCFRGLENLIASELACVMQVAGIHGGGSPQMETITMMSRYDINALKGVSRYLFGIDPDLPIYRRETVTPRIMLEKFRAFMQAAA